MNPEQQFELRKKGVEAAQEISPMYDRIQHLPPKSFKRKCGVKRETFEKMVEVLKPKLTRQGKRGGQGKFGVEDQLLIAMEYWREYRTQFHIGQSWGIHETTVGRIVRKIENILIQSGEFRLPGKKALHSAETEWNNRPPARILSSDLNP